MREERLREQDGGGGSLCVCVVCGNRKTGVEEPMDFGTTCQELSRPPAETTLRNSRIGRELKEMGKKKREREKKVEEGSCYVLSEWKEERERGRKTGRTREIRLGK